MNTNMCSALMVFAAFGGAGIVLLIIGIFGISTK